ncbi:MAG TPA: 5'-3' exonuclease H3TH domain-containing protein [Candidatus Krumholzibacteria bacterium]|nr:5'-3' exonuclease H3TH domain-containing protein [Candidatus Krumholzibacteria bacterium]
MARTAWLIDGMAYVFRSYYGMRPLAAPDGTPVNAVFGLGMTLQRFLAEHRPELLACCFDAGAHTFRNTMFPEYKANRGEPPADLVPQFDLCRELVGRMGIATVMQPGWEADDLIATLTTRLRAEGIDVVIVSGDKDLAQLLGPGVRIHDLAKGEWLDAAGVPGRMGVRADQVADLLALTGDAVDNVPGVRGVGPKAASALLAAYPDLDAIYADLDGVAALPVRGAAGLKAKLEAGREAARLSRALVGLDADAPCAVTLDELHYRGADSAGLDAFAERWGLGRVAVRVPRR